MEATVEKKFAVEIIYNGITKKVEVESRLLRCSRKRLRSFTLRRTHICYRCIGKMEAKCLRTSLSNALELSPERSFFSVLMPSKEATV